MLHEHRIGGRGQTLRQSLERTILLASEIGVELHCKEAFSEYVFTQ